MLACRGGRIPIMLAFVCAQCGPPADPGMVKVSVPEARRLARLAAAPMTRAARDAGYAWSRWRRRHQARARWHHYHARLKAAAHSP
jgi:hypothetical protein